MDLLYHSHATDMPDSFHDGSTRLKKPRQHGSTELFIRPSSTSHVRPDSGRCFRGEPGTRCIAL